MPITVILPHSGKNPNNNVISANTSYNASTDGDIIKSIKTKNEKKAIFS